MEALVPITTPVAFAAQYENFLNEHVAQPFAESAYLPPLLFTPHLSDPNRNLLKILLTPLNTEETENSELIIAQRGQSNFSVEWRIIQRSINLATVEMGTDIKTFLAYGSHADLLKAFWLDYLNLDSFKGHEKGEDAETLLRNAIKWSASGIPAEQLEAIRGFRESSALFSSYGLSHAAAMVRELAWQTNTILSHDDSDTSWRKAMAGDHFFASQCWYKTTEPLQKHPSYGMCLSRGINNALKAEQYDSRLSPLYVIDQILIASAKWFMTRDDKKRTIQSLLHSILRQIHPLMHGRNLPLDEWTDIASILDYISTLLEEQTNAPGKSSYDSHLDEIQAFAASAHRFADIQMAKEQLKRTTGMSDYFATPIRISPLLLKLSN